MAFWDRTKTNRLKLPKSIKLLQLPLKEAGPITTTMYGQPFPTVGDFVWCGSGISAGTVGKVIELKEDIRLTSVVGHNTIYRYGVKIEMLSGEVKTDWINWAVVLDQSAVQEVKDFYIADGRPERIKVAW